MGPKGTPLNSSVTRGVARNLLRGTKEGSGEQSQKSPSGVQGQSRTGCLGASPRSWRQMLISIYDGGGHAPMSPLAIRLLRCNIFYRPVLQLLDMKQLQILSRMRCCVLLTSFDNQWEFHCNLHKQYLQVCTYVFRTCVFQPCKFILCVFLFRITRVIAHFKKPLIILCLGQMQMVC